MSLSPLPKELAAFAETQARHCALMGMVKAYGQQCRAEALEEAVQLCEYLACTDDHDATVTRLECAEKIRGMK